MSLKVTINHGLDFSDRRKTNHRPYDQNLEGSILEYFIQLRRHHLPVSGLMLRAKAKEIKNDPKFVASNKETRSAIEKKHMQYKNFMKISQLR